MTKTNGSEEENVVLIPGQTDKKTPVEHYGALWNKEKAKNPSLKMARVTVSIRRHTLMLGEGIILAVEVFSANKPGRGKHGEREFYRHENIDKVREMAGVLAGALAELCCNDYGDTFEPDDCVKAALDTFDKIKSDLEAGVLTKAITTE